MQRRPQPRNGNQAWQRQEPPTAGRSRHPGREAIGHLLLTMPELFALGFLQCLVNNTHRLYLRGRYQGIRPNMHEKHQRAPTDASIVGELVRALKAFHGLLCLGIEFSRRHPREIAELL